MEVLLGKFLERVDLERLEDKELERMLSLLSLLDTELRDYIYGFREVPEEFKDLILTLREIS
jgi:succinate dehydrogenase flavin-adding protein (antitoxin of CptAB toxin-antitoxin module)